MVGVSLVEWSINREFLSTTLGGALPVAGAVLIFELQPRVRFFDGGVEIPPTPDQKKRFLSWPQVERYSWDGDTLILTGTRSVLAGGPAQGGSVRIPRGRREAVEQILSKKVRKA